MQSLQTKSIKIIYFVLISIILFNIGGCATQRPRNVNNLCAIFSQKPNWYADARRSQRRWGVPTSTLMAIMWQESRFQPTVKPRRMRLLGFIPWRRPTSADGFSQATYRSWWQYQDYTNNFAARRSNFKDAVDFVGWYSYMSHKKLGIPLNDTYALYLAYHEGWGGYAAHTYRHKRWLINIAWRVKQKAILYHRQLVNCWRNLQRHGWF